ncbi:MAG: hypothetical protein E5X68_24815 [Mesorhizobium sp.]|nr:MAG: hypothetical protein EOQ84_20245 [Mesorhizobium sp.]RWL23664.1 MAG: hypothetical protein EOR58_25875 [Mesorhizobium sp.]RWL25797.1 MAG: hypothetical protein EOR63_27030 [Mesorhizobium sp.]RWL34785.1 MAG: hypothetical protein EOR59_24125 [Mesorhizobium sp.]RWL45428.1 MAG: hypothetical protein EOR62_30765 [Mesorhizobium sp.]
MRFARALRPAVLLTTALLLAGCGTSGVDGVPALRLAIGNSLAGAEGMTADDPNKIDRTMASGCAVKFYTPAECDRHTKASAKRRAELKS